MRIIMKTAFMPNPTFWFQHNTNLLVNVTWYFKTYPCKKD